MMKEALIREPLHKRATPKEPLLEEQTPKEPESHHAGPKKESSFKGHHEPKKSEVSKDERPRQSSIEFSRYTNGLTLAMEEINEAIRRSAGMYRIEKRRKNLGLRDKGKPSKQPQMKNKGENSGAKECDAENSQQLKRPENKAPCCPEPPIFERSSLSNPPPCCPETTDSKTISILKQPCGCPEPITSERASVSKNPSGCPDPSASKNNSLSKQRPGPEQPSSKRASITEQSSPRPDSTKSLGSAGEKSGLTYCDGRPFIKGEIDPSAMCTNSSNVRDLKQKPEKEAKTREPVRSYRQSNPSVSSIPKSRKDPAKLSPAKDTRTYCDGRPYEPGKIDPSAVCSEKKTPNVNPTSNKEEKPLKYCDGRPYRPAKPGSSISRKPAERPRREPQKVTTTTDEQIKNRSAKPFLRLDTTKAYTDATTENLSKPEYLAVGATEPEEKSKLLTMLSGYNPAAVPSYNGKRSAPVQRDPTAASPVGSEKNRAVELRADTSPPSDCKVPKELDPNKKEVSKPVISDGKPVLVDSVGETDPHGKSAITRDSGIAVTNILTVSRTSEKATSTMTESSWASSKDSRPRSRKRVKGLSRKISKRIIVKGKKKRKDVHRRHRNNDVPKSKESCRPKEPMPKAAGQSPRVKKERETAGAAKEKCEALKQKRLQRVLATKKTAAKNTTDHPKARGKNEGNKEIKKGETGVENVPAQNDKAT